jgi:cytoskeletal protein RodZ
LQTVGEILRAEREKKGISVKDVETATSIRSLYLQAIEEGNYKILPGEVYLKGFIRNYANFLGLDGQEMVNMYRQSLAPDIPPVVADTDPVPPNKRQAGSSSAVKWIAALLGVLLLAGVAWLTMSMWDSPTPPGQPVKPVPQAQNPAPVSPQTTPAPATPATSKIVLIAKFTGESWTLVNADGKDIYEGIPKIGESLTWTANNKITIKLGNAAAVNLTFNGQPQGKLGEDGEVIVKTYPANTTIIQKP